MDESEVVDYMKKKGGREINASMGEVLLGLVEKNPNITGPLICFDSDMCCMADPAFRRATRIIRRRNEIARGLIEQFGAPEGYVVLNLHPECDLEVITKGYGLLEEQLEGINLNPPISLILLANDEVIGRYKEGLSKSGFAFSPDWKEPDSNYHFLLEMGKEHGLVFDMFREGQRFGYRQAR
ncbi:MAG: hypothetical protein AABX11_03270 [Nanoarchaeota archaeon]